MPAFLEGFAPDLIAEREGDRVVIEVKRSDAVRGSNDLTEIAERVSRAPGWRFELITMPAGRVPTRMEVVEEQAFRAMRDGHTDSAFLFVSTAVEVMLSDLAAEHGMKVKAASFAQTLRSLVSHGIVSREDFDNLEKARGIRNLLAHGAGGKEALPTATDVENLLAFLRRIDQDMGAMAPG